MDGNFNYRPKAQPRTGTGTLPGRNKVKERGSKTYSSSEDDFHSDDNLRPYEEVKVAHHDKKLNGLGLTPEEHDVIDHGIHGNSNQCNGNHDNHKNSRLYTFVSGSDGDVESDYPLCVSARHHQHARKNFNHQGSQCSISSNEIDNEHATRDDQAVSRLSLSDSDDENHHDSDHRCHRGTGPAFPCFPPPPPPPPIEDIPGRTPILRQRSFGPSNRGNYSDAETCLCQGHFVDAHTALLHRGAESDLDNHPRLRHCPYSDCESEFEPHYLEQTSSGNVFIPDGQPRFPRTVPRSGSVPVSRSGELFGPCGVSPHGNTVPHQFMNGDHHCNNIDKRHPFTHPQFSCPQTAPAAYPPHMSPDYRYYSKFSVSQSMKKRLRQRCSWKCTALLLVVICVALLACTAYFAAMSVFEEKEKLAHNPSACNMSHQGQGLLTSFPTLPTLSNQNGAFNSSQNSKMFYPNIQGVTDSPNLAMPSTFHIGDVQQRKIPSKSSWPTQFKLNEPRFIKLNFSISSNAILGVFGRRNIPPTVVQFDFFEVFDGSTIASRSKRSARYKRGHFGKDTALIQHLDAGIWYMTLFNDKDEPQFVSFKTEVYDTLGTDCPNDCHGHGDCYKGQCRCFPGYTGWDCSQNQCQVLCNGNGQYDRGVCRCHPGWKGRECEIPEHECEVPNCNGNGRCINGLCVCLPGFKGPHCGLVDCLLPNCSGNGVCQLGTCVCYKGFKGSDCSLPDKLNISQVCARNCSGHGTFDIEVGQCICERFFTGLDCEREICRLECAHGHCKNQKCVCDKGWGGALCDQVSCDARCDGLKGICDNGTCVCRKGWNGNHCTIDGCPNSCSNHGDCRHFPTGWMCSCHEGWKGKACDYAMEVNCKDGKDNDGDGLTDCLDPDCCLPDRGCGSSSYCKTSPDPAAILLRKQPPSTTASFYEKTRFLIEENSVQIDTSRNAFNESQVSLIRGKVRAKDGTPLIGVRVHITRQPLYGYTLTREHGLFDILVNGGGSVTLEFTRSPFRTNSVSVMVPWNQIITMDPVVMAQQGDNIYKPDPAQCGVFHDHFTLKPVVLPTWQHTQLGACPEKSTVIPESQVLQESIVIPGTDVHLVYHSSETDGYKSVILIQLTPNYIPPNLSLVHLKVSVQGIEIEKMFEADPGLKYTFSWDRKNAYTQKVYGIVPATVRVGYQYAGCSYVFWEVRSTTMSGFDLTSSEIGGWNLDIHHTYNFQEGILHKGDGTNIYLKEKPQELVNILGTGQRRKLECDGCNGRALENRLLAPVALASGRDGSLYVWDHNFIRKLSPGRDDIASILQTSTISTSHKTYMTVSPVDGRLYISDYMNHRIIRVATMGPVRDLRNNFEVVAGNGEECTPGATDHCGDGERAVDARLVHPKGIAISKDGIIYIADNLNIRMITPDGMIHTVIGSQGQPRSWEPMSCDDSQPANKIRLQWPTDLAINPLDDTLHILDKNIILKLTKDRSLVTVAGRPINCPRRKSHFLPSGVLSDEDQASGIAVDVKLINPQSVAFGPHGEIYIVESDTHSINRVRVVTTDGRIHHFAGTKSKCDCQKQNCKCFDVKETLAAMALFKELTSVTVTPDGITHIADAGNLRVFSIMSKLPQSDSMGQYEVVSPETQEVYIFNRYGQHQNTINIMTNQYMYNFTYNVNSFYGKLISILDDAGNKMQLVRDYELQVNQLISIDGSRSRITVDNMRRLHKFVAPDNSSAMYWYIESTGLLKSKFVSDGRSYTYEYDDMGRLLEVRQPTGEITTLTTDVNTTGSIVHFNTDKSDAVAMATYGSVQSVMHGSAETRVTYLPDGAVVVVFPTNLSISIESGGHPILANQHRMHFKRKLIGPKKQIHKLEWRFYLRRKGRTRQSKIVERIGHRMRVGAHFSRHVSMHDEHEDPGYKGKALLINGENLLTVEYDRETHTESIMDKDLQEIITIAYDNSGLPTHFLPANHHHALNITYSQSGQITQWQYGEMREQRFYRDNGLLREITTSSGSQYRFQYRYGRMPTDIMLPSGLQYYLEYDSQGNLMMVKTPGLGRHYFSRAMSIGLQRYLYQIPELSAPYTEEYDGNGKLLQIIYPSEQRRVIYRYNSYSQIKTQLYDETEVSFEYDEQISKLSTTEVVSGPYNCYQVLKYRGAVISEYQVNFSKDRRLKSAKFTYQYDNNFRLTQIHGTFSDNFTTSYDITYDKDTGKLKLLKSFLLIWPLPDRQQISNDHVRMTKVFDNYGRLQSTTYTFGDDDRFSLRIGYDLMNRIHHWNCQIGGNTRRNLQYLYDKNGNVIDIFFNGKTSWRYGYDNNGNINKITEHAQTRNLEFDVGDRIKKSGQKMYKFDRDGFMIQRHDQHITHNSKGQLTSISKAGEFRFFYFYDSEDRLAVIEDNGGSVMQFYYADINSPRQITHTYNQTSDEFTQYFYNVDGNLIAMERRNKLYYVAVDPMGTPIAIFNSEGGVEKELSFNPLGFRENDTNPSFDFIFGFQGGIYNPLTNLLHLDGRIYDTNNGHWISPDYSAVMKNIKTIPNSPTITNNYQYPHLINVHSKGKTFPSMVVTEWLLMLGFDVRSLAPDVSYTGEIRPKIQNGGKELLPMSSAFECTFLRDMESLITMSTVPKSHVSPLQEQKNLQPTSIPFILGDGVTLSQKDRKVVVGIISITPEWAKQLALVLVNGSHLTDLRYNINGKDVHFFVKEDATKAEDDLRMLGIHSNIAYFENGINVTVNKIRRREGFRLQSFDQVDVRLHGVHSVMNIRYGTTVERERQRVLRHAKNRAIERAWDREKWILQNSLPTQYRWSEQERQEILTVGYADGYEGHYIRSPELYPELSDDCNNIRFIKGSR